MALWLGTSGNWNASGNWQSGLIPNAIDAVAQFSSTSAVRTVSLSGGPWTVGILQLNGSVGNVAGYSFSGGTLVMSVSSGSALVQVSTANAGSDISSTLQLNSTTGFDVSSGSRFWVSGAVTGAGGLVKLGTGAVLLTGTNSYLGTTILNAGTLQIGDGGVTGTLGSGSVIDNATVDFNRAGTYFINNAVSGTGSVTLRGGALFSLGAGNTYSGGTTIGTGTQVLVTGTLGNGNLANSGTVTFSNVGATTFSGIISGTGVLQTDGGSGSGVITLSGANTYTGATSVTGGTLKGGTSNIVASSSSLQIAAGGTFSTGGFNQSIKNLSGAGTIVGDANALSTLTLNETANTTFAGTFALGNNDMPVVKAGAGTLTFTGTTTGAASVTISAGTLALSGTGALPTSVIQTSVGATFDISAITDATTQIADIVNAGNVVLGTKGLTLSFATNVFGGTINGDPNIANNSLTINVGSAAYDLSTTTFTNWFSNDIIRIVGNFANNVLTGSAKADTFVASTGTDVINGGAGADIADYSAWGQAITATVTGGNGTVGKGSATDTLTSIEKIVGTSGNDNFFADAGQTLDGSGGANTLYGLSSNATWNLNNGSLQNIQIVSLYTGVVGGTVNATLATQFVTLYGAGSGAVSLTTGTYGGWLIAEGGSNTFHGGADNGAGHGDIFVGNHGTSEMFGGNGSNVFYVGAGDLVHGNLAGAYNWEVALVDNLTIAMETANVNIVSLKGGNSIATAGNMTQFVTIFGGASGTFTMDTGLGGGWMVGNGGSAAMTGHAQAGNSDLFAGGNGTIATMNGGNGINYFYTDGDDIVHGAGQANKLYVLNVSATVTVGPVMSGLQEIYLTGGNNTVNLSNQVGYIYVFGASGIDTFIAGTGGNQIFYGGGSANVFKFSNGWGTDVIADWATGAGNKIDLTALAAQGVHSMADLQIATGGGNTSIAHVGHGSAADVLTLTGYAAGLSAVNFLFA